MEFKLPELGEGVTEGELVSWKVKPGDTVKQDQILCEVMTDKATVEVPSPFAGKITSIQAKEGDTIEVHQTLLQYEGSGAAASSEKKEAPKAPSHSQAPTHTQAQTSAPASMTANFSGRSETHLADRVPAAPVTRKFAREMGVELSQVQASGPNGRVMKEDVQRFLQGGMSTSNGVGAVSAGKQTLAMNLPMMPSNAETKIPFKGLRKKISEKMRLSKDKAAHFTYVEEADATKLVKLRSDAKAMGEKYGIKVTYLPFVMKAMVAALRKYPIMNSHLDEEQGMIVQKNYYNIGLSVQTEDGLTAPVIKHVEQKSVLQLAKEIQEMVDKARAKKLSMEDLTGGTITLTNAGSIGGLFATPVINFPEVSILGFNKIFRKPIAKMVNGKEEIVVADWTYFSISLDHRIVDGAVAAEFMKEFIRYIEEPALLIME